MCKTDVTFILKASKECTEKVTGRKVYNKDDKH